jgi:hypothetical protein
MIHERRVALACALIALATTGIVTGYTLANNEWQPSALVRMVPNEPLALVASAQDPDFKFSKVGHYDGVYFYAIATDPLAFGLPSRLIDASAYHYARPAYGWFAWLASGGGKPSAVPYALLGLNLLAMPIAAFGASRLSSAFGSSAWAGLIVGLHPGFLYAVTVDTSEVVSAALGVFALYAWKRGRIVAAGLLLCVLCLSRESLIAVPIGLAVWEIIKNRSAHDFRERLALLIAVPLPLAFWWTYIYAGFGLWPFQSYPGTLAPPFFHWLETVDRAVQFSYVSGAANQLGTFSVPLIVATGALMLIALVRSLNLRSFLHPVFLFMGLVASSLSVLQLLFPKDLIRTLALQLALAPAMLVGLTGGPEETSIRSRFFRGRRKPVPPASSDGESAEDRPQKV